jgi:hypothetical protein
MQFGKFRVAVLAQLEVLGKLIPSHVREVIVAQGEGWGGDLVVVSLDALCRKKKKKRIMTFVEVSRTFLNSPSDT